MAGVKGRSGGRRPGAGRKPKPRPPAPPAPDEYQILLAQVRRYAEAGVDEQTILEALAVDEARLKAEGRLEAFRRLVGRALATCRAELLVEIKDRSEGTKNSGGSVNALALRARNLANWDRQGIQDEQRPDLSSARERLALELKKLADNKTAILGFEVSELDLLYEDRHKRWPWDPEAAATP
jgi:hypothetical protein